MWRMAWLKSEQYAMAGAIVYVHKNLSLRSAFSIEVVEKLAKALYWFQPLEPFRAIEN